MIHEVKYLSNYSIVIAVNIVKEILHKYINTVCQCLYII